MGIKYYDREGNHISQERWSQLLHLPDYKRVAFTQGCGREVSTVWLGLDHGYSPDGPPIIFETMVFRVIDGETNWSEIDAQRYSTEEEALKGHQEMCSNHAYVLDRIVKELEGDSASAS